MIARGNDVDMGNESLVIKRNSELLSGVLKMLAPLPPYKINVF